MATNLNPGADGTLVQAAYAAAMANVPQDQTAAYEQLALGYTKFTEGMTEMYKPLAQAVGEATAPLVEKVKERVGENLQELWLAINTPFEDDYTNKIDTELEAKLNLEIPDFSTVERGVENADVKAFQYEYLKLYGKNALPLWGPDGRLGTETEAAIEKLRKEQKEATDVIIEPGDEVQYKDANGQLTNISLIGQDDYIYQFKDKMTEINEKYNRGDISLKEKTALENDIATKIKNAKNSVRAFSKEQVRIMNLIKEGNFNPMASGAMNMDFINAVMERGRPAADGSRVIRGYDEDGNIALMWIDKYGKMKKNPTTGKSWVVQQGQMKKFIVEKDNESELNITTKVTTAQQTLGASGLEFDGQEVMNDITKMVSNEKTFLDMINTKLANNTGTFVEHVYGVKKDENNQWTLNPSKLSQELYMQLTMLGDRFDADKDGDVDAQDFNTPESRAALANYLTSYNPTSVNAFASFMKDTAEKYHAQGAGMIKPAKTKTKTKTNKNEELMGEDNRGGSDNTETNTEVSSSSGGETEANLIIRNNEQSFNKIITSGATFGDGSGGGKKNWELKEGGSYYHKTAPNYLMNMSNDDNLADRLNKEYSHLGFYFWNTGGGGDGISARYYGRQYDYTTDYRHYGGYRKSKDIKRSGEFKSNPAGFGLSQEGDQDKTAIAWGQEIINYMKKTLGEDPDLQGNTQISDLG